MQNFLAKCLWAFGYTGCQSCRKPAICAAPQPFLGRSGAADIFPHPELDTMDSFQMNKILGAVLGTCLVLVALNIASGAIFAPEKPAKPGFDIAVPKEQAKGGTQAPAAQEPPIETLLASADPKRGEDTAHACGVCHTFEKGGPNKIGPNLWGIVGRARATEAGFDYSDGMKQMGGTWTIDDLNKFLTKPMGFVPGTKMTFAGLARPAQRADVIAYLNSLADNPKPLPTAKADGSAK
jgi:cytochrome c